jgi:hypothetical protein
MTPAIEFTSVPDWAVAPRRADADPSGRYWTVVAFRDGGRRPGEVGEIAAEWVAQIRAHRPSATPRVHVVSDDAAARRAIDDDTSTALVGWRLMIVGPADACLRLRAHAIGKAIGDDEITVATTDVAQRDVHCAHCRAVTRAAVELSGYVECCGCGRTLAVQSHVSRRIGAYLGVTT